MPQTELTEEQLILRVEAIAGLQHRADLERSHGKALTACISLKEMEAEFEVVKAAIHGLYQELDSLRECVKRYRGA